MPLLPCPIAQHAHTIPSHKAIVGDLVSVTYEDLHRHVTAIQHYLYAQGITQGNRVAIHSTDPCLMIPALFALFRLQAVAFPLSTRLPEGQREQWALDTDCVLLLTDDHLQHILLEPPPLASESFPATYSTHQLATILLTSGSTGTPKCAVHSFGNHYYSALGATHNMPLTPGSRWLLNLPLFHVGGLGIVFRQLLDAGTIVLPSSTRSLLETLARERVTHVSMVPTQLYRLVHDMPHDDHELALEAVLIGGAPLHDALREQALALGLPLFTTYGLTEMASQVTTTASSPDSSHAGAVLPYREINIDDQGVIWVKGHTLFQGYLRQDYLSLELDKDNYFCTGDCGYWDKNGHLVVTGRRDNLFISGGENIHPEAIEAALMSIDGITQAVVVPVAHPEWGHRPVAYTDTSLDADTIKRALGPLLPKYQIPDEFRPWPSHIQPGLKIQRQDFSWD